jgi:histidinol dehydrogenase
MKSLNNYGAILILDNLENAAEIIDIIAPEHLHLQNKTAKKIFNKVKNVGCIFLGVYSSEVFGDYIVGTNHILPTSGTAKFSSGLGVLDFMKRTSYVSLNQKSFENLSNNVTDMASIENLDGHKLSVTIRQTNKK